MVDYAQRQQSGCELDPGLHEERLLGLLGSREQVLQHQQQESDCRVNVRLRREELLLAQANAGVMDELEKQSAQAWLRLRAVQEQQDIFEAQSRGAGDDGQG
ncbi:hypothetical protein EV700_2432 [Fluviicoccus keumensis]|uniref:Uncharacterized protein n=2 Tax=Fluviicoccus keumensis TaxID=1435465 RepID=A0A4Q7YME6_9GAMM|nr:hypothetical protein EV700_2432 [Fluviicoccus keumensis]